MQLPLVRGNLSIALLETNPRQLEAQNFDRTLLAKNLAQAYLLAFCNLMPTLFTFLLDYFLDTLPDKKVYICIYICIYIYVYMCIFVWWWLRYSLQTDQGTTMFGSTDMKAELELGIFFFSPSWVPTCSNIVSCVFP